MDSTIVRHALGPSPPSVTGQASALIVADLYRLSRSSTEFARIIEALDEADAPLYVVGQGRVSLPAAPELGIMLAIAEYEAEHSEEDFTL